MQGYFLFFPPHNNFLIMNKTNFQNRNVVSSSVIYTLSPVLFVVTMIPLIPLLKNFGSYLWVFAVLQTWHNNKCHMYVSLFFFKWNKILVWIVLVLMGAIRDLMKTNYTEK